MKYRKFNMEQLMKWMSLSTDLTSVAMQLANMNKCLKCKHTYEKKEQFASGGIVVNINKEEKVMDNIDIQRLSDIINKKEQKC